MTRTPKLLVLLLLSPMALLAQKGAGTKDTTVAPPAPPPRAGWLSDRRDLRVGDLLLIVVDEHARSSERTANAAHTTRAQTGALDIAQVPADLRSLGISYKSQSDKGGQIDRSGGLDAMISVRVTAIEANGVVKVEGQKLVAMDGRKQEVTVTGLVRTEDVGASNTIASSRIANATISYKGKSISPATGIFGKILAILWP